MSRLNEWTTFTHFTQFFFPTRAWFSSWLRSFPSPIKFHLSLLAWLRWLPENFKHASDKDIKTFGGKYEIFPPRSFPPLWFVTSCGHLVSHSLLTSKCYPSHAEISFFRNILQVPSQITFAHWLWYGCPPQQEFISCIPPPPPLLLFFIPLSSRYIITASKLQSRDRVESSLTSKTKDIHLGNGEFMSCFHIGKVTVHALSLLFSLFFVPSALHLFLSPPNSLDRPCPFLPCRPEEHNMWDQTAGK